MSVLAEIESQVRAGRKIHAIKDFRAASGVGLKEAKEAVEYFQARGVWEPQYAHLGSPPLEESPEVESIDPALQDTLDQIGEIGRTRKIEAIKRLRELSVMGLKEAKEAVEHYLNHGCWQESVFAQVKDIPQHEASSAPVVSHDPRPAEQQSIELCVGQGRKIQAIKELRDAKGIGLKEAKQLVDQFIDTREWPSGFWESSSHQPAPPPEQPPVKRPQPRPRSPEPSPVSSFVPSTTVPSSVRSALAVTIDQHLGQQLAIDGVLCAKRSIDDGHICLVRDQFLFIAEVYGEMRVEYDAPFAEITSAEVRQTFGEAELVIKRGYSSEYFSEMDEADARALADFINDRAKR